MLNEDQVKELVLQALETEIGGVQVYTAAIECAVNEDLREEWQEYLEQTQNHESTLQDVVEAMGLDPDEETPGRLIVRHHGESLVKAMKMARRAGDPAAAQLVAAECVLLAETKDHQNWELLGEVSKQYEGPGADELADAYEELEDEEDEHYYHTMGWARELWLESLGLPAVLPPPEEQKDVKTAIGAARAKSARKTMAKKKTTKKAPAKAGSKSRERGA